MTKYRLIIINEAVIYQLTPTTGTCGVNSFVNYKYEKYTLIQQKKKKKNALN